MKEKPLYTFRGVVKVGYNMVFCLGGWPFSKMDFLDKEIIVSILGFKKIIPYSKIKELRESTKFAYGGYSGYVRIIHESGGFPFVAFRIWTGPNSSTLLQICKILKSKGVLWKEIKDLK